MTSIRWLAVRADRMAPASVSRWARRAASLTPGVQKSGLTSTFGMETWFLGSASPQGPNLLAMRARLPTVDTLANQLVGVDDLAGSSVATLAGNARPSDVLALARVLALSTDDNAERRVALALYEGLLTVHGPEILCREPLLLQDFWHSQIATRLAIDLRATDRARQLLELLNVGGLFRPALLTDLLNPALTEGADHIAWLRSLNSVANWHGDDQFALRAGVESAFDRMTTRLQAGSIDGPLVSVIVPCFRPDLISLRTAVNSVLAQTHGNVEILLVDDASGPEWRAMFEDVSAADPRIRLIVQPINAGTYVARNRALAEARGEFVAFQDSDDWSHPRRLEKQLEPLRTPGSAVVATHSAAMRANDDLVLAYRSFQALRHNASSIIFRREPVLERTGGFTSSRKGSDTEFALRLAHVFPERVLGLADDPTENAGDSLPVLAVVRLENASTALSRSDFRVGYRSADRWAFHDSFQHWHTRSVGTEHWKIPVTAAEPPFPLPLSFRRAQAERIDYDRVVVVDIRSSRRDVTRTVRALTMWSAAGLSVGVVHVPSPDWNDRHHEPARADLLDLLAGRRVDQLALHDAVHASTVIIPNSSVLRLLPQGPWNMEAGAVHVAQRWTDSAAALERIALNCRQALGVNPTWQRNPLPA
jgi:glycosyltransferase involved in cell wall biosynthesis